MVLFHRLSTLSRVYLLSTVLSSFFFFFSSSAPFLVCEIIIIIVSRARPMFRTRMCQREKYGWFTRLGHLYIASASHHTIVHCAGQAVELAISVELYNRSSCNPIETFSVLFAECERWTVIVVGVRPHQQTQLKTFAVTIFGPGLAIHSCVHLHEADTKVSVVSFGRPLL